MCGSRNAIIFIIESFLFLDHVSLPKYQTTKNIFLQLFESRSTMDLIFSRHSNKYLGADVIFYKFIFSFQYRFYLIVL